MRRRRLTRSLSRFVTTLSVPLQRSSPRIALPAHLWIVVCGALSWLALGRCHAMAYVAAATYCTHGEGGEMPDTPGHYRRLAAATRDERRKAREPRLSASAPAELAR
mmetsp:Transcript_51383/g.151475  ORF Transcript_51383/g.151475 Transcript_51383/m.151475 type:complete len:107 (+) Transcript_51383:90-410(+)|eukprot:6006626-Prymnesium_polylepis.2